jgi:glycosyltransferase involved in cell wall biosynthesis
MQGRQGHARVLWVTEEPPDRKLGGGNIRQSYLFQALASVVPTDLLVVGPVTDEHVTSGAVSITELPKRRALWSEHPVGRRAIELAITFGSRYPMPAYPAYPGRRALGRAISARRTQYDLVCVEHETLAPLVPRSRAQPWIITFHHLLSRMIETELGLAPGRRQRWFKERDLGKARRLEQRALRRYARCVVCSSQDAVALGALGDQDGRNQIAVVPNGVDLAAFNPSPIPRQPRILLPGTLAWGPNVDGAVWFCAEVWPLIRTSVPEATLVLAGRSPVDEVLDLGRLPGVSIHADVPSMVPYFESTRLVVVPLRVGTGTRLKALEAMAAGRPVVGTTIGLDGIGAVDGTGARVADDPEAFASAVVETLTRDDIAGSLARSGRAHVERDFGWDRIGSQFVAIVSELLEREEARRGAARSPSRAA